MNTSLNALPIEERIRLVEDLWDSIAAEQSLLSVTDAQRAELERRLAAYRADGESGRTANLRASSLSCMRVDTPIGGKIGTDGGA